MKKPVLKFLSVILSILLIIEILPTSVIAQALDEQASEPSQSSEDFTGSSSDTPSDVTFIGEDESKREENVKHFLMSDGSFTAVAYSQPVHYKPDGNDEWVEIDNSLSEHTDSAGETYLSPVASPVDVKLAKTSTESALASFTVGEDTVSWVYDNPKYGLFKSGSQVKSIAPSADIASDDTMPNAPENTETSVMYSHMYNNVDIEYTVTPTGLKENIILKSKNAQNVFNITYSIGSLSALQTDSRTVTLYKQDGSAALCISAPYMTDALGETSDLVSFEIVSQSDGVLKIKMTADKDWLSSSERKYPVTVDPYTWKAEESPDSGNKDVCATAYSNAVSSYPYGTLAAGTSSPNGASRSYVQFKNLPKLRSGDFIVSASLALFQFGGSYGYTSSSSASSLQVNISESLKSWTEASVIGQTDFASLPTPSSVILDYQNVSSQTAMTRVNFDISSAVKGWYTGKANNGLVIRAKNESEATCARFTSNYYNGNKPTLIISYLNNKGLEDRWTYHSLSLGDAGASYTNDCTGNLVFVSPIASTTGSNSPMSLSLVYNGYQSGSAVSGQGAAGLGWRFDCQQKISAIPSNSSDALLKNLYANGFRYIYTDPDGTEHYFKLKSGSTTEYTDEEGLNYTLTIGSTNEEKYILSFESGGKITFTYNGYVRRVYDADKNYYRYDYNDSTYSLSYSKITSMVDGGGRTFQFGYDNNRNIINIKDHANRNTSFTYNSDNRLTTITYPDGGKTQFTYDSSGRLTKCTSVSGDEVEYSYFSGGTDASVKNRVASVRKLFSGTATDYVSIDYSHNSSTVFTDSMHRSEKYLFDNAGRTVCVTDALGNAAKYTYTSDSSAAKNNLSTIMTKTAFVDNLLSNHSFEQYDATAANKFTGWVNYGTGGTVAADTSAAMLGNNAVCINKTTSGGVTVYQSITVDGKRLTAGKTYTFSAYIKTDSAATNTYLFANCIDTTGSSPVATSFKSAIVNEKLGSYTRMFVTFTIPENTHHVNFAVASTGKTGKTWFDCAQLELGSSANDYNLVENGGFERSGGWSGTGLTSADTIVTYPAGTRSYKVTGEASAKKCVYQDIPVNKPANKCAFSFSGKVTADSVSLTSGQERFLSINSVLIFSDGTEQYDNIMFTPDIHDTQFTTGIVKARQANSSKTISKIRVRLIYYKNMNAAYFDDISLNLDETGTSYTYDSKGNLISAKDNADRNQTYSYNNYKDLVGANFEDNTSYTFTYDKDGTNKHRLLSAKSNNSNITVNYAYDDIGHCTSVTVSAADYTPKIVTSSVYGGTNARYLASTTDALGNVTRYEYNDTTGLTSAVSKPSGTKTSYAYDSKTDMLISVTEDKSAVSYTYNSNRSLKSIQSPTSTYNFTYNKYGSLDNVKVGTQTLVSNTYYSANTLLFKQIYGNTDYVKYTYDSYDRPHSVTYTKNGQSQDIYTWEYDSKGNVSSYTENGNTDKSMLYTYDLSGRLIQSMVRDGSAYIRPSYDAKNLTTGITYKFGGTTGSMTYTYDENMDNAPTASNFGNSIRTKSQYDNLGRLSIYAAMNEKNTYPYTASYSYLSNPSDSAKTSGVVSGITYRFADIPSLSYTYDKNGNITKITSPSDSGIEFNYTYDKHDQLLSAYSKKDGYLINYVYDYGGNITSKKYYNAANPSMLEKTVSYEYGDSNWKDKLTKYDGKAITYDSVGNMLTFDSQTFTWLGRRLMNYAKGSTSAAYSYNSDGIRTKKTVGSAATEYMLNGSQILAEQTGSTMIKYFYDSDGKRASFKTGNKYYFYVYNVQGDVTHIVDTDKNVVATYEYDPYGKILNLDSLTAIGKVNPFRYRGYYYDSESNLYYLNSRYYNPEIGRFINADGQVAGVGGEVLGSNLFSYCSNNPINRMDSTGKSWVHWVIGGAIVAACAAATVITCGGFAAAVGAVAAVGSGMAATSVASTIAAGAFIGSASVYGMAVLSAASTSNSVQEFNDQGNWGVVAATAGGAVFNGAAAYAATRTPRTTVYRSVNSLEAQDIQTTGQFNLAPGGMESKQFGFNLSETRQFGNAMGQNTIVSAKVPNDMLNHLYTGGVDTSIFRSGTLTVYEDQLETFNQAVSGTIKFMQ